MLNLDTHMLLLGLSGDLTDKEKDILSKDRWSISSIVIWEITKLYQLHRINLDPGGPEFRRILNSLLVWPITIDVCMRIYDLDFRSDPADEIICATSIENKIPLVTRDKKILKSKIVPLCKVR